MLFHIKFLIIIDFLSFIFSKLEGKKMIDGEQGETHQGSPAVISYTLFHVQFLIIIVFLSFIFLFGKTIETH